MHYRHPTRLRRIPRVGVALERGGIRATYAIHDRIGSNRKARSRFRQDAPALDDVQRQIVDAVDASGFTVVPFAELFPEPATWEELAREARSFVEHTEQGLAAEATGGEGALRRRAGKEFVVRRYSYGVDVALDDPWLRLGVSRRMLDVANASLRLWSKLEYFDLWYSVPQPQDASRVSSQRWHRDYNDRHLLKAFLYLVDVDAAMGPFQYVPGSAGSGPYAREWPWRPLGDNYPGDDELAARVPDSWVETFTGPAGTMVFCNTSGFHRGGLSTSDPRVLATWTYSSPASLASLTERSYRFTGSLDELDALQRFAVT
ncbi:MAG: phytanoyl-CoA dioxygenase family protein [Thermoleophilia bacterium]|nr:phytanoyl-CoA dioxygenase family protein [Thermoleophilia bacterium]MDH4347015.1 phytanoyl-CoA dioxygenase family protein [Thermoleophilia bacterium]